MAVATGAGLKRLRAPLPLVRRGLLDAATLVAPDDDRWLRGGWISGLPGGLAGTHDPCSTGTDRDKDVAGTIPGPMAGSFSVYKGATCDSRSVGPASAEFEADLRLAFQAVEGEAVERVFATGDGHSTLGSFLTDGNLEVLAGGVGVSPTEGLALLEEEIASHGVGGLIHAAPITATYWASAYLIEEARGQLRTRLGTTVVVGAGYIAAANDSTNAGEQWAWATGPVEVVRDEVEVVPADYAQALDRSNNDVLFLAERRYIINWVGRQDPSDDEQIQAGVLIDRAA